MDLGPENGWIQGMCLKGMSTTQQNGTGWLPGGPVGKAAFSFSRSFSSGRRVLTLQCRYALHSESGLHSSVIQVYTPQCQSAPRPCLEVMSRRDITIMRFTQKYAVEREIWWFLPPVCPCIRSSEIQHRLGERVMQPVFGITHRCIRLCLMKHVGRQVTPFNDLAHTVRCSAGPRSPVQGALLRRAGPTWRAVSERTTTHPPR